MDVTERQPGWYVLVLVSRCHVDGHGPSDLYDESVRLVLASSEAEALGKAARLGTEAEHAYANSDGDAVSWRYVGVSSIESLAAGELADGVELWSRLTRSEPDLIRAADSRLIVPPANKVLRHGAMREALMHAHATAVHGPGETRSWDAVDQYVAGDDEGNVGVVAFVAEVVVGVVSSHEGWRAFDVAQAIDAAPVEARALLERLVALPLMQPGCTVGVTAVFWAGATHLESCEPWHTCFAHGADLLERELLDDRAWIGAAADHYGCDRAVAARIGEIARRDQPGEPLMLTGEELEMLLPAGAPHREAGLECLFSGAAVVAG